MITIFQGRKISLDGTSDEVYATVAVNLREHIHLFNTGKSCNPFAVFMAIALHTDQWGWSYPGRELLKKETGISTDKALSNSLKHLRDMQIDGHYVIAMYRERVPHSQAWGKTAYRIFPGAWTEQELHPLENAPGIFENLQLVDPIVDYPPLGYPPLDNDHYKYNQDKVKPLEGTQPSESDGTCDPLEHMFDYATREKKAVGFPTGWDNASEAEKAICKHVADLWCGGILPSGTWGDRIEKQLHGAGELLRYHDGDVMQTLGTIDRYHVYYEEQQSTITIAGPQSLVGVLPSFMAANKNGPKVIKLGR